MKTHSFKKAQYKYEGCNCVGQSVETMEVNNGKGHNGVLSAEIVFKVKESVKI